MAATSHQPLFHIHIHIRILFRPIKARLAFQLTAPTTKQQLNKRGCLFTSDIPVFSIHCQDKPLGKISKRSGLFVEIAISNRTILC